MHSTLDPSPRTLPLAVRRWMEVALVPTVWLGGTAAFALAIAYDAHVDAMFVLIPLSSLLVALTVERLAPWRPAWAGDHGDLADDLWSMVMVLGLANGILAALTALVAPLAVWDLSSRDVYLQALVAFLALDFAKYWFHRATHRGGWLWRVHCLHHEVGRLHVLNAFRHHPIYPILTFAVGALALHLAGFSERAIQLAAIADLLLVPFVHANIRVRIGWLNRVISTVETHRRHHSTDLERGGMHNFAAALNIWDQLFGTFYWDPEAPVPEVGMERDPAFPNGYLRQLSWPFAHGLFRPRGLPSE